MLKMLRQTVQTLRTSLTGMAITAKYFRPGTEVTRQYPEAPVLSFERTRGRMDVKMKTCTACTLCAKSCPVECITIETEKKLEGKGRRAARFVIDFSRCMFCGLCVEACPTGAIRHTGKCDFSSFEREALVEDFGVGFYREEGKTRIKAVTTEHAESTEKNRKLQKQNLPLAKNAKGAKKVKVKSIHHGDRGAHRERQRQDQKPLTTGNTGGHGEIEIDRSPLP